VDIIKVNVILDQGVEGLKHKVSDLLQELLRVEVVGTKFLIGAKKHVIWDQIIVIMDNLKIGVDVVWKTKVLTQRVQIEINKAWTWLGDKAQVVEEVIKFLNGKTRVVL
jgi:hypothetical protein